MTRVLSSTCIVLLLLLATGGRAWAGGKSPIAILGLEVYDSGNGIDPETTKAAKELTAALRDRARAGTGPYVPVPGEKELIDEKLLNNCDSEAAPCMAAIGTELGAEVLMYGKIEKPNQNPPIYKVSIKLLNVFHKQLVSSIVETLPLSESTGVRASTHAKAWYAKLVGGSTGGTVVVKANIDRGTVMLDDEAKGNLASGTVTLSGVAEGRHTLAIEAKDYQRYETSITVRNGETLPHTATLVEMSKKTATVSTGEPISVEGTEGSKGGSNIWKPVFYGTAAVTVAAAGFSVLAYFEGQSKADNITSKQVSHDNCTNQAEAGLTNPLEVDALSSACSWYNRTRVGWVVTGVVGAAAVGSFIMAFVRDREHTETRTASGGHRKRRELAITPVISPDGGGATVRFDW
jgi:hypothetical protein